MRSSILEENKIGKEYIYLLRSDILEMYRFGE